MKFIALKTEDGERKGKIAFCCKMLGVSRQGFYRYLAMWARMKTELLYDRCDPERLTVEQLKSLVWRYFMSYWNNRRICSANGGLPPISQYTSQAYFNLTKEYGITPSMSRRGNCYDNALTENFFGILKAECIYRHKPETFEKDNKQDD